MPVELWYMREQLPPGLMEVRFPFKMASWDGVFGQYETTAAAPHIWVPKLTLPQAVALGAAAAIIKNPTITRRFWQGWNL